MKFIRIFFSALLVLFFTSLNQKIFSQTGSVTSFSKVSVTSGSLGNLLGNNYYFGVSLEDLGDFDNDGVRDLAVGAIGYGGKGAVLICLMNSNGTVKSHNVITEGQSGFTATLTAGERFGFDIANIGDLDNDGVTDLVVSQESNSDANFNEGAVYVIFLNSNGTVKNYHKITSLTEVSLAPVLDGNDRFGEGVTALGDLDGDGNEDVAVSAQLDDDGGNGRGAAYVLFLNSNGTLKSFQKISDTAGNFTGILDNLDNFGASIESIGDFDGDGKTDIAVGAVGDADGGSLAGAIWLLYLNSNGTVKGWNKISATVGGMSSGPFSNSYFGYSIANLGDIDGDAVTDIAVGAINELSQRGAMYTIRMNPNGTVKSSLRVTSGFNMPLTLDLQDWFGSGMVGVGDVTGDGKRDIVVAAQNDDDGSSNAGAFYILALDGTVFVSCTANASFTASADTVCIGTTVNFTNTSTGATGYVWRENGTAFATTTNSSRTFSTPGTYTIRLTADDGLSCVDSTEFELVVVGPPSSVITPASSTNLCIGDSVNLVGSGGGAYQWFLNGIAIPAATNSSLYASVAGTYSLEVTQYACSDTDSVVVNIGVQDVMWTDFVNTSASGDTLFETTGSNGWGNKGAASVQVLQPGQDGGVSHLVHENKGIYYVGLSYLNTDASQLSIDHAFYVNKSQLVVREAIGTNLVVGSVTPGDSLVIVRVGSNLTWLKNGTPVYTRVVNSQVSMVADVALFKKNSYLTNVWVTFCSTILPLTAQANVMHNLCANSPSGMISLNPNGGIPPYSYLWSNGDTTSSTDSLDAGSYSVTIYDANGGSLALNYEIFNRISWVDQVNTSSSTDTLVRTLGGNSWGNSGARSLEVMQPNASGSFIHVVHEVNKFYYIGLSDSDPDAGQTSIGWAFYNAKGTLRIREAGSGYFAVHGTVSEGDTLKIERSGSTLYYYKNASLLRSASIQASLPLFVDASIYNDGVTLYDNFCTFCSDSLPPDSFYASLVSISHANCFLNDGAVTVMGNGGVPPYSNFWNSLETTASISGKSAGNYYCVVTDQNNVDDTVFVEIFNKIVWEGFVGSTANGDTLMRTAPSNGWGQSGARSDNKALNGSNGKVVHKVNSIGYNYYIGLSDADTDASQFTIDYAFYNNKGNLYIREQKTGFFQNYGTVAVGDTLVVERRISSMYWYQNGNLLRSIGISPTETLRVDVSLFSASTTLYDVYVDFCDTVPGQKRGLSGNGSSLAADGSQLLIYPNPSSGVFTLEVVESGKARLETVLGQEIWQGEVARGQNQIRLPQAAGGIYLLRVQFAGGEVTRRVIIDRTR
ncbi:MAG: FG-GAP repeat protein [Bacteroidia bacterium]|nr:FG-GAP repeat protein [Bacteroidia bacterium]